ncbi:peptide MFS transporter [Sinimarinibacterium flocculans]|uniref:peptide MFS transporter n=1 Tax=Sinimarinibacterium flocculans TaxID=985250 RepID=UPI0035111846
MTASAGARPDARNPEEWFGHPKGLYVCFFTEMWERFSFYGMKALLFLYLTKYHLFGDAPSYDLLGAYGGLVYAVPVIGGMIADRYLGMRKAVILGAVLLCLGHFGMAFEGEQARFVDGVVVQDARALQVFYLSLALIVTGVGFLKPNISSLVGRLYADDDPRRDSGFTLFVAGINLGALFASLVCGYLGETYGWKYGFGAAGVGMLLGLVVFITGQKHLHGHAEPRDPARLRERIAGPLNREWAIYLGAFAGALLVWQLIQRTWTVHGAMHLVFAAFVAWFAWFLVTQCTAAERGRMLSLVALILCALVFYTLYEQTYGSWVAFTDRLLDKNLLGLQMTAGSLTFLGAFFIVGLSPLFAWLWPWLAKRGLNPSTPVKSAIGLLFAGLAFLPMLAAARIGVDGALASVWWLVLAYLLLEIGEVCLYPIGLSAVSELSVRRVVSVMMGAWFLATAYSEVLAAAFGKLSAIEVAEGAELDLLAAAAKYAELFWMLFLVGAGAAVIALLATPLIRRGMHATDQRT